MKSNLTAAALAVLAVCIAALVVHPPLVVAQQPSTTGMPNSQMMEHQHHMMQGQSGVATPTMPGQDGFGAIQEIVRLLEADPTTDWSKVNLEALRQHLIDMNEVTLKSEAVAKPVEGGIEVTVTGTGRAVEAIKRMVPAHAHEIEQSHLHGWSAKTESLPDGVVLTVTSTDAQQVQHIRGLGFIGAMASGVASPSASSSDGQGRVRSFRMSQSQPRRWDARRGDAEGARFAEPRWGISPR